MSKQREKMKIFHGLSEVAGQAYYSVQGLREAGATVHYIVWNPSPLGYKYDISLNIDREKKYLLPIWIFKLLYYEIKIIRENDVFHFHYGRSLLLNYDLWFLKKKRKKIFYEFHGSDLRDYRYAKTLNPYFVCEGYDTDRDKIKYRVQKICKYADGIILHDDELMPYIPDGFKNIYILPLRINVDNIDAKYVSIKKQTIRIVHAPTKRDAKGSEFVFKAVQNLKNKYCIEFILVENKTQQEAMQLYQSADIIVDQLRAGTYGVFAIEGMAMGKPVITYITDEMREKLPEDLPICSANPDTIEEVLEKLLLNGELRHELGIKGRKYVEKYHDYKKNAKMLLDIYRGDISPISGREAFSYASHMKI